LLLAASVQRHKTVLCRLAIDEEIRLRAALDDDPVVGGADAQPRREAVPCGGKGRPHIEALAFATDAEDVLDRDAIEPAGRAGVPRPAAAPGLVALAIDVGGDHI